MRTFLRVFVVALTTLIAGAITGTTSVGAATLTYDVAFVARVDIREINAGGLPTALLSGSCERSASPSTEVHGTATTPFRSFVATEAASGFGGLSKAAEFGPQSYRALSAELRGTGLPAHHLIEKRFAGVLGQSADDMLSVAVTPAEHQVFTNAWRQAVPYGAGTSAATPELITATARQVYSGYPEILKALGLAG